MRPTYPTMNKKSNTIPFIKSAVEQHSHKQRPPIDTSYLEPSQHHQMTHPTLEAQPTNHSNPNQANPKYHSKRDAFQIIHVDSLVEFVDSEPSDHMHTILTILLDLLNVVSEGLLMYRRKAWYSFGFASFAHKSASLYNLNSSRQNRCARNLSNC